MSKLMKRFFLFFLFLHGLSFSSNASHITGGEIFYTFMGVSSGQYAYAVTLKLYKACNSIPQFADPIIVSIFDKSNNNRVMDISVPIGDRETINLTNTNPCISNPPVVCYDIAYYYFTIYVPGSPAGYIIASQANYRINGITNLIPNYSQIGATYTAEIPGTANPFPSLAAQNSSAHFTGNDLVMICTANTFTYNFSATDADGDQLRYSFCDAYQSGTSGSSTPPPPPPYASVPYDFPSFSGATPLGNNVQINQNTGVITGIAPAGGIYVVTVCVEEIRSGTVIATHRKDLQINVADCSIAAAALFREYMLCRNSMTITIANQSNSTLITSYNWEFINSSGAVIFTSTISPVTYTFPDTGMYVVKLAINRGQQCADSTTAIVRVYPGLIPGFNFSGICLNNPTLFTDGSSSVYGIVNSWKWDFGEPAVNSDTSSIRNPNYIYPSLGTKIPRLIITDTKGCRDTLNKTITILTKPPLNLLFNDTLICRGDVVQLQAGGMGTFNWAPNQNILNANTATPIVNPPSTIKYYVSLFDNNCTNTDSVNVRVVNFVTLQQMNDTTVCSGDSIQLRVQSDGLQFYWTPVSQVNDARIINPIAITPTTTVYNVTAVIGGCSATKQILVTAVPYPLSNAGPDTIICYNTPAQLQGSTDGSSWKWAPSPSLNNSTLLNPVAYPPRNTVYVFTAFDTKGCPKPGFDTMLVSVLPRIIPFAGNDTSVVMNQPLQLKASGGVRYNWSPSIGLSATDIADPIALYDFPTDGIRYTVMVYNNVGCSVPAFVTVKVFATVPTVFVPTAFTPNNDGRNDVLKPIAVGMQRIEYFNIYNRWGQLVFSTTVNGQGWNGKISGHTQGTGTYVWMVKAIDYKGTPYFQKGTVTLIR